MARACADARHTNGTHAFPQTTLLVVSKSRLIASLARHLLVRAFKKNSVSKWVFGPLLSNGRQRVGAF